MKNIVVYNNLSIFETYELDNKNPQFIPSALYSSSGHILQRNRSTLHEYHHSFCNSSH